MVHRQVANRAAQLAALGAQRCDAAFAAAQLPIEGVEPFHRARRQQGRFIDGGQLPVERGALVPFVAQTGGHFDDPHLAFQLPDFVLQLRGFQQHLLAFSQQRGVARSKRVQVGDLAAEPVALRQQPPQQRWAAVAGHQVRPPGFQFVHHLAQRDAIQAGGQIVQQPCGHGVVQRAQFLQFAQADGKHVVVRGFVDAAQNLRQAIGVDRQVGGGKQRHASGIGRQIRWGQVPRQPIEAFRRG